METVWHNFDALNQPLTHPSRSPRDTFYVDDNTLLRTHTSTGQIRAMESRQPPVYIAVPGRTYRRDTPSPKNTPVFHQIEALAVDRNITLADLKGTCLHFCRAMFGEDREFRMRTNFFPFTEPSVEFDMTCFLCEGRGCAFCKHTGWYEMGGAGGRPGRLRERRLRPERVERLRLGPRARPHRRAAPRHPGHPDVLGERPPRVEAILMRVLLSWLRDFVDFDVTAAELAQRLLFTSCEVGPIETRGVADTDGNLGFYRVGRVLEAGKHPNADRLQLCSVDVGEEIRARSCAARGTSRPAPPSQSRCPAQCFPDDACSSRRRCVAPCPME